MNEQTSARWAPSPPQRRLALAALIVSALMLISYYVSAAILLALLGTGLSALVGFLGSSITSPFAAIGVLVLIIVLGVLALPLVVVVSLGALLSRSNTRFMSKNDARVRGWAFALGVANLLVALAVVVLGLSESDSTSWSDPSNLWILGGALISIATVWLCRPITKSKAGT